MSHLHLGDFQIKTVGFPVKHSGLISVLKMLGQDKK